MGNKTSIEQNAKSIPKGPTVAEVGLIWALLLTPIAGAIAWSVNWNRLGKPQRIWWTLLSGILVAIMEFFISIAGYPLIGIIVGLAWIYTIYGIQKSAMPPGVRTIGALIVALVLTVFQLGYAGYIQVRPTTQGGQAPSITIGTSFNKNSQLLAVSGSNLQSNEPLYARLQSSHAFGTSQLTVQLEKKNGSGWYVIDRKASDISPNENIVVMPLEVTSQGTYRVDFLKANNLIAQKVFTTT